MRKIVLALVILVVGITAFASTKVISVLDSNNKQLLTTQEDSDTKSAYFYDIDEDFIEIDFIDGKFYIYINGLASRSTYLEANESIEQWDKYSKLAYNEFTDDNGHIGDGLIMFGKSGYTYVVQIYRD